MNSNEYNTLINNSIINDIELINSRQMSNYNIKNTMNNTKENEENHCNNELIYDKMKIIDLSYEQDSNNKTDQQYEMIGKLIRNEIMNLTSFSKKYYCQFNFI